MKSLLALFVLIAALPSANALSFRNLRLDQNVPQHCKRTDAQDFKASELEVFTISVQGSIDRGFTFEYPITRNNARLLFKAFNSGQAWNPEYQKQVAQYPDLHRDFVTIMNEHESRDFRFVSEGEVLEILSLWAIQKSLDHYGYNYFVSGSIEYAGKSNRGNRGELDVVIAHRDSCEVMAYGEAKLGAHRLRKAQEQVQRFSNNLSAEGFSHQLVPPSQRYIH